MKRFPIPGAFVASSRPLALLLARFLTLLLALAAAAGPATARVVAPPPEHADVAEAAKSSGIPAEVLRAALQGGYVAGILQACRDESWRPFYHGFLRVQREAGLSGLQISQLDQVFDNVQTNTREPLEAADCTPALLSAIRTRRDALAAGWGKGAAPRP